MSKDEDAPKADVRKPAPGFFQRYERKWMVFWIVSILSLVFDQITKIWARAELPVHPAGCDVPGDIILRKCIGMPVKFIDGVWEWRLSMNPGSAFGLFGSLGAEVTRWLLSIVGIAAVIGMVYMLRKSRPDQKILHWALALVAGGAVGNLIDRIYYSVVTDFILWKYKTHEWPVFNIADVALVVGVGLMFIDIQKENKREKAKKKEQRERAQAKAKAEGLVKH